MPEEQRQSHERAKEACEPVARVQPVLDDRAGVGRSWLIEDEHPYLKEHDTQEWQDPRAYRCQAVREMRRPRLLPGDPIDRLTLWLDIHTHSLGVRLACRQGRPPAAP